MRRQFVLMGTLAVTALGVWAEEAYLESSGSEYIDRR